jgi:hypothetical protein
MHLSPSLTDSSVLPQQELQYNTNGSSLNYIFSLKVHLQNANTGIETSPCSAY